MIDNINGAVFKESPLKKQDGMPSATIWTLLNEIKDNPAFLRTKYRPYRQPGTMSSNLTLSGELDLQRTLFLQDGILVDSELPKNYRDCLENKRPYVGTIHAYFHHQPNFYLEISYLSDEDRGYPKGSESTYQKLAIY